MGADTLPDGDALGSEQRAQPRDKDGRFASTGGSGGGKSKHAVARMGKKESTRVSHQIATDFPKLKSGTVHICYNRNHKYVFKVNGFGDYTFTKKKQLK